MIVRKTIGAGKEIMFQEKALFSENEISLEDKRAASDIAAGGQIIKYGKKSNCEECFWKESIS